MAKRHRCFNCGMFSASAVHVFGAAPDGPYSSYRWYCRSRNACERRMRAKGIVIYHAPVNPPRKRRAA